MGVAPESTAALGYRPNSSLYRAGYRIAGMIFIVLLMIAMVVVHRRRRTAMYEES